MSMSPPPTAFILFLPLPPLPSFARGPIKGGGVACPPSFDSTLPSPLMLSSSLSSSWALTYYVDVIATSLDAPSPLLLCRRLSFGASLAPAGCRFANYLDVPPSLLLRWLVVTLLPLSLCRSLSLCHLSHCAAISLGHRPSQPQ